MKKLIALIIALVACAVAPYAWLNNKFQKELKLNEELRKYRKLQADLDIMTLQTQLDDALTSPCILPATFMHTSRMKKQMEILNRMHQRI